MNERLEDNRRARLVDYAPWMLRDYFTNQGPSTAIVVLLLGFLTLLPLLSASPTTRLGHVPPEIAARMLRAMLGPLVSLGALFATNGIVSNDRKLGYYRFLFSKPVSPAMYYAATFVAYGIGFLGITCVLMGVWTLAVERVFPIELLGIAAAMYVGYGGIGFLLSAAWRFDWLSLVTVLLVANVAWTVWGTATGIRHWPLYLLPPVHRTDAIYAIVQRDELTMVPWGAIGWVVAYGVACFLIGLLVIRKRPLGT